MKVIYKYNLEAKEEQDILMPRNALFVDAAEQKGIERVWFCIDIKEQEQEYVTFYMYSTGEEIKDFEEKVFIKTIHQKSKFNGALYVVHLFYSYSGIIKTEPAEPRGAPIPHEIAPDKGIEEPEEPEEELL